jgi:hypothetical protein
MSLYTELIPYIEYVHSIRKLKNYLSFDIKFPIKWSLPKSIADEGQIVVFESDDQNLKGLSFVSSIDEKEISLTLSKIGKIIKLNKERELKEKLFKQTIEQLKQTFEKNDLDKLQNLYFDFDNTDLEPEIDIEDEQDGQESTVAELAE